MTPLPLNSRCEWNIDCQSKLCRANPSDSKEKICVDKELPAPETKEVCLPANGYYATETACNAAKKGVTASCKPITFITGQDKKEVTCYQLNSSGFGDIYVLSDVGQCRPCTNQDSLADCHPLAQCENPKLTCTKAAATQQCQTDFVCKTDGTVECLSSLKILSFGDTCNEAKCGCSPGFNTPTYSIPQGSKCIQVDYGRCESGSDCKTGLSGISA
jgi:hypothetical protein